ncbi:MAG: hypothetical protein GYB64_16535 [Chloroflexi bacterium]|nr:hypothetical protein [Chloroflexota bacterium]
MPTCPRCGYDQVTPAEGFSRAAARRRVVAPILALSVVLVWALLYLTLPVAGTIAGGSINWPMTLIVAAMWPLAGVTGMTIYRVALDRAMADAYVCDRCGVRWPRR